MKAVAVPAPGEVEVVDVPPPVPADYECLVKVDACGLCNGTDLKIIDDHLSSMTVEYPVLLGHEGVGTVVEVGPRVRHIQPGETFTNPIGRLAPGTPYKPMWAAMAEYAIVQDHRAMDELGLDRKLYEGPWAKRVPSDIPPVEASLLLTLKEAYSALRNFGFRAGMEVLVYGDGPVGLALARLLRVGEAGWVGCVGHHDERLRKIAEVAAPDLVVNSKSREVEAELGKRRVDLVVDAVGSTAIIRQGSRLLKSGGKVGVFGVLSKEDSALSLIDLQNNTSVHMLNWPVGEHAVHDQIVRMVLDGKVDLKDYYSHALPAERVAEAVQMVRRREALKVILTF